MTPIIQPLLLVQHERLRPSGGRETTTRTRFAAAGTAGGFATAPAFARISVHYATLPPYSLLGRHNWMEVTAHAGVAFQESALVRVLWAAATLATPFLDLLPRLSVYFRHVSTPRGNMTKLLEAAFEAASKLSAKEQDSLAASILAEVESERRWDALFEGSVTTLGQLADEALEEHHAKRTLPFVPKGA